MSSILSVLTTEYLPLNYHPTKSETLHTYPGLCRSRDLSIETGVRRTINEVTRYGKRIDTVPYSFIPIFHDEI